MTTMLADIRFGARMLLKSPMMTFIALLALTLGIGANTAIFSVVNAVLLRTFPYTDPERLVLVWEKRQGGRTDQNVINLGNFTDWKQQNQVFSDMAVFFDRTFNLTSDGEPEEVPGNLPPQISSPCSEQTPFSAALLSPKMVVKVSRASS